MGFDRAARRTMRLEEIRGHLQAGYQAVYDADLKGYFDSIPQERLMACLRLRIADRQVLQADSDLAGSARGRTARDEGRSAEGEPVAEGNAARGSDLAVVGEPVLALVRHGVSPSGGPAHWAKAKLVRYADDFVVLARLAEPETGGVDRGEVGNLDGIGDQSGQDAGGGAEAGRSESGLSGIHVSVDRDRKGAGTST